jgi:hypothetical protein
MTGPPVATRPSIQLSGDLPANATTLSKARYDVRSEGGSRFLFTATRDHGERGIAEGVFRLVRSSRGDYLERKASAELGIGRYTGMRTFAGHTALATGSPEARFRHNEKVCGKWKTPDLSDRN